MIQKRLHENNRLSWNAATVAHNSHKGDQAEFFRRGGDTLYPEERELLGDLAGQRLVHLQCNAGQDSLSLARRGAMVTGVDISDVAIDFATKLSTDAGIPASFVRMDLYDWLEQAGREGLCFDIAFTSYGALCWLSDIYDWARGVAGILKPGGRLVVMEFHPFAMVFEDDWSHTYPYFCQGKPFYWEEGVDDYVAHSGEGLSLDQFEEGVSDFENPHPCYDFNWGIAEIVSAILDAGLALTRFQEYPYSNGCKLLDRMRMGEGRRFYPPDDVPSLPLMYGLQAVKSAG